uniref:Uncharacterized protein n=1 Tax=Panagrolaimus superbus TaxID=310955 RepID=A0A914XYT7_9BILA
MYKFGVVGLTAILLFLFNSATPSSATTSNPSECGEWSEWSCKCCGGCPTQRCTRICQATSECPTCSGEAKKEDSAPCSSPSETCKFPLPVCCEGQEAYANSEVQPIAKWCRTATTS